MIWPRTPSPFSSGSRIFLKEIVIALRLSAMSSPCSKMRLLRADGSSEPDGSSGWLGSPGVTSRYFSPERYWRNFNETSEPWRTREA
jgi:hypothetical protein